jgi:hypothetical protein
VPSVHRNLKSKDVKTNRAAGALAALIFNHPKKNKHHDLKRNRKKNSFRNRSRVQNIR